MLWLSFNRAKGLIALKKIDLYLNWNECRSLGTSVQFRGSQKDFVSNVENLCLESLVLFRGTELFQKVLVLGDNL